MSRVVGRPTPQKTDNGGVPSLAIGGGGSAPVWNPCCPPPPPERSLPHPTPRSPHQPPTGRAASSSPIHRGSPVRPNSAVDRPPSDRTTLPPAVTDRIADAPVSAHLATSVGDRPHVAPVRYGYRDQTIYCLTGGTKLANVRRIPASRSLSSPPAARRSSGTSPSSGARPSSTIPTASSGPVESDESSANDYHSSKSIARALR